MDKQKMYENVIAYASNPVETRFRTGFPVLFCYSIGVRSGEIFLLLHYNVGEF